MDAIITLTGNLGADPRIRTVGPELTPVTEFGVAHTPRVRQGEEWVDGATTWYRITCWRRLAENVVGSLRRGDAVIVTGRLRPTEWIDKNGVVQRSEEVEAITLGPDLSRTRAYVPRRSPRGQEQEAGNETEITGVSPAAGGTATDLEQFPPVEPYDNGENYEDEFERAKQPAYDGAAA